jgi:hypothetical protein
LVLFLLAARQWQRRGWGGDRGVVGVASVFLSGFLDLVVLVLIRRKAGVFARHPGSVFLPEGSFKIVIGAYDGLAKAF